MDIYYIYQADVYCEECGAKICDDLDKAGEAPEDPDDQYSYDSDEYPKECCDSGESDSPQHCACCMTPLNNELTREGVQYALDAIREELGRPKSERDEINDCYKGTYYEGSRHVEITRDWAEQLLDYSLDHKDHRFLELFLWITSY